MKNREFENRVDIGKHCTIRSSKTKEAMIGWETVKFNSTSGRWFERNSYGFTDWHDAADSEEDTIIELREKRKVFPTMCARESFCEVVYCDDENASVDTWILLTEHEDGRRRHLKINLSDITYRQMKELERGIERWHKSGVFETRELIGHFGPWVQ